jgi:hypothetical protein
MSGEWKWQSQYIPNGILCQESGPTVAEAIMEAAHHSTAPARARLGCHQQATPSPQPPQQYAPPNY